MLIEAVSPLGLDNEEGADDDDVVEEASEHNKFWVPEFDFESEWFVLNKLIDDEELDDDEDDDEEGDEDEEVE